MTTQDRTTDKATAARLRELLAAVESRLGDPIRLASLAEQFGASPFFFHRMFRAAVGETPRRHVERLRLERAFFLLALMDESIIDICRVVGFKRHETFSRSFKRHFRITPSEWRQRARSARAQFLNAAPPSSSDRCQLSNVRFRSLRPAFLLAHRRVGDYATFDYAPFTDNDRLWTPLVRWAIRHEVRYQLPAWGLTHDIPGITPPAAQRFDGCIRVDRAVSNARGCRCLRFDGGTYAVIEHVGERSTIMAAYSRLVHGIGLALDRYAYREGPSLTIYRRVHVNGDPLVNHTTVCIPVTSLIEQEASKAP